MISIDRRTVLLAAAVAGALPACIAIAREGGEVLDMTSTYPHYAARIGYGRAAGDAAEVSAEDRAFGI